MASKNRCILTNTGMQRFPIIIFLQNITMPELFPFSDGFYEPLSDTK